jgi:hypothetical protein
LAASADRVPPEAEQLPRHLPGVEARPALAWALTRLRHASKARSAAIELKFGLGEAAAAAHLTNALPFRLVRCSKYVLGINRVAAR